MSKKKKNGNGSANKVFSAEVLRKLILGDTITTEGMLQGFSDDPIVWRLIEITEDSLYLFNGTYFGVFIGDLEACINDAKNNVELMLL